MSRGVRDNGKEQKEGREKDLIVLLQMSHFFVGCFAHRRMEDDRLLLVFIDWRGFRDIL
jgi:hypothetical protein